MLRKLIVWVTGFVAAVALPFMASAATLTTPLTVGNAYPSGSGSSTISGNCGTAGANNSVSFSLNRNGVITNLPTNISADATGAFNGTVSFPPDYASGAANLTVRCNGSGDVFQDYSLNFAQTPSASFNLNGVNPTLGGAYPLTGACGSSNGSGTVALSLVSNGTTTSLGTANLTSSGTFNSTVAIPSTYATGSATLMAICSNGTTFSSPVTVNGAAVNNFTVSPNATIGGSGSVSGSCGTITGTGTATFSLLNNGMLTPLTATNNSVASSGAFNANISYPTSYNAGPATLVVTCPNGATYTSPVTLAASGTTSTPSSLTMPTGTGLTYPSGPADTTALGGTPEGEVAGAATITPSGGVNAGSGPRKSSGYPFLGIGLLLIGAGAVAALKGARKFRM